MELQYITLAIAFLILILSVRNYSKVNGSVRFAARLGRCSECNHYVEKSMMQEVDGYYYCQDHEKPYDFTRICRHWDEKGCGNTYVIKYYKKDVECDEKGNYIISKTK